MHKEGTGELISAITAYLSQQENLIVAYLFGSLAEEVDHPRSDIDVALLLPRHIDRTTTFDLRLETMAALGRLCRRPVDVVILNNVPSLLRFQVIRHGQVLLERDRKGAACSRLKPWVSTMTLSGISITSFPT